MRRRDFIVGLGVAGWPLAARGQQPGMPVIKYLSVGTGIELDALRLAQLRQALSEQGYVEGRNLAIEYRFSSFQFNQLPKLAADLVSRQVAVIIAVGGPAALAAKSATATIPIIFAVATDPVELGLVSSLNPTSNLTGFYVFRQALTAKRLQLLHEIAPSVILIGLLTNPAGPLSEPEKMEAETAARALGVQLTIQDASTPAEIEAAFAKLVGQRIGGLLVGGGALSGIQRDQLVALTARHSIPAIYGSRRFVEAGGLISYGERTTTTELMGTYVGRILKGAKPADLPVIQPTKFEFVINLKTAKTLGFTIPPNLLALADEVIE
jgi:putative ABC transport system substrate-binding protein